MSHLTPEEAMKRPLNRPTPAWVYFAMALMLFEVVAIGSTAILWAVVESPPWSFAALIPTGIFLHARGMIQLRKEIPSPTNPPE